MVSDPDSRIVRITNSLGRDAGSAYFYNGNGETNYTYINNGGDIGQVTLNILNDLSPPTTIAVPVCVKP